MMTCREAARLMSERLDHPLGRRRDWALRLHVLMCAACRHYNRQIRWLHERLRGEVGVEPEARLDTTARQRILTALHTASTDGESRA